MKASSISVLRLFKKHITRLFTIIAIVIVSIGFMSGISEVEACLKDTAIIYYKSQNISDLYLKSKKMTGFSVEERDYIKSVFKEENVMELMSYEIVNDDKTTRIYSFNLNDYNINKLELLEGEFPRTSNEVLVERKTKTIESYDIGSEIKIYEKTYTVSGIVENPLIIQRQEEYSFLNSNNYVSQIIYINSETQPIINDIFVTIENREIFKSFNSEYKSHIEEIKQKIYSNIGEDNISILTLYENIGLYSLNYYAEKIGKIAIIFVVFFLLVTLLVCYSTMSRLLDEERGQIACQKTLGYSSYKIVKKYILFVLVGTIIGGIISLGVGMIFVRLIYVAMFSHFDLPSFKMPTNFIFYYSSFGIVVLATTLLTYITGMKIADKKPAELLIPKAAKIGKKVLIERIPIIWNHLKFKYKSTFRNVFLFKSRFFMTVISIIGSSVLVFAGIALFDNTVNYEDAKSIMAIAIAIIIFSAILSALVIYNLTNINVSERNREIATLMVLGYHEKEVTGYIFREIYIMSFIGAVIGLPFGLLFLKFVFNMINFGAISNINWWTYLLSPAITISFSFFATLLLKKKITKIDMNTSLKSNE